MCVAVRRLLVAGHKPGAAPGTAGGYAVLSGRLSDVRGFNDFLQDFLVQVRAFLTPLLCLGSTTTGPSAVPVCGRRVEGRGGGRGGEC
jgi:hypothetical protein